MEMENEALLEKIKEWKTRIRGFKRDGYEEGDIERIKEALQIVVREIKEITLKEGQKEDFEDALNKLSEGIDGLTKSQNFEVDFGSLLKSELMKEPVQDLGTTPSTNPSEPEVSEEPPKQDEETDSLARDEESLLKPTTPGIKELNEEYLELGKKIKLLEGEMQEKTRLSGGKQTEEITRLQEEKIKLLRRQVEIEEIKSEREVGIQEPGIQPPVPEVKTEEVPVEENADTNPETKENSEEETKPEPKKIGLAANVPTIARIQKVVGEDPVGKLNGYREKYLETMADYESKQVLGDHQANFFTFRTRLEGTMSVPEGLDLTNEKSLRKAAQDKLATMLEGLKHNEGIKKRITEDQEVALENFIMMRMMTGQYQSMDLANKNLVQESLHNISENDELLSDLPVMKSEHIEAIHSGDKISRENLEKILKECRKINEGLYAYKDPVSGKPNVLMTKVNKTNIKKTIDTLDSNPTITWYGLSKKKTMIAEIECCRRGKKVFFKKGNRKEPGPYSKHMPKNPENYVEWYKKIYKEEGARGKAKGMLGWQKSIHPTTKQFVQDVIDSDEKKLLSFWQDVSLNGDPDLQNRVRAELTSGQRKTLESQLKNQVKNAPAGLKQNFAKTQLEVLKKPTLKSEDTDSLEDSRANEQTLRKMP